LHINSGSQGNGEKFLTKKPPSILESLGPYQIKHFLVFGASTYQGVLFPTDAQIRRYTCPDGRCTIQSTHDSILISCFGLFSPLGKKPFEFLQSHTVGCHFIASFGICNTSFYGWINLRDIFLELPWSWSCSYFFKIFFCCFWGFFSQDFQPLPDDSLKSLIFLVLHAVWSPFGSRIKLPGNKAKKGGNKK